MIEELKVQNAGLKTALHSNLFGEETSSEYLPADAAEEHVSALGDEKKKLERELRAVENRIKHIMAEHEEIESEMAGYDAKAKKILEARSKKIEWEKQKEQDLKVAEQIAKEKREDLARKAAERDLMIAQRRETQSKQQEQVYHDLKTEKKIAEVLKDKVIEYERVLKENKKLQTLTAVPPSKIDQLHRIKNEKKQKREFLMSKARLESQAVNELDKKLEKLKQIEQRMLEEKKVSLTQKGLLKSHLQDIMNKKMQESEIQELLANKDRHIKSSGGIRRKSLSRILEGDDVDHQSRTKSPGLPTKFVGGNIGSYTEMRNQTWAQRNKGNTSFTDGPSKQSHTQDKSYKPSGKARLASPQGRMGQARPITAPNSKKGSTVTSPKGLLANSRIDILPQKPIYQSKLTRSVVLKPTSGVAAKPASSKAGQKSDALKQVLATAVQKAVMRGRGNKKETPEQEVAKPVSEVIGPSIYHDADVQIESPRYGESDEVVDNRMSQTQLGSSTIEFIKQVDASRNGHQFQFEGRLA